MNLYQDPALKLAGDELTHYCHKASVEAGWWKDITTGADFAAEVRNGTRLGKALVAEKLCLIHSEISEAMEGHRKGLSDDKLPHRLQIEVELADAVIRILDLAGSRMAIERQKEYEWEGGYQPEVHPFGTVLIEKMDFNANREDHQIENRRGPNGKRI